MKNGGKNKSVAFKILFSVDEVDAIFAVFLSFQDLLLKKYCCIVLQRTFYQLQFWRRHLFVLYNTTYIHISVNSAVELLSRDTALIHNHKSTLFASALKPCRLNVSFTRWSDMHFFLSTYAKNVRTKKPVKQRLITKLSIFCANTVKTHKVYV